MARRLFLSSIALFALAGCRTSPHLASYIENNNAQMRQLEDEYWLQVQENERLAFELEKLKRAPRGEPTPGRLFGRPRPAEEEPMAPPVVEEAPATPSESPPPTRRLEIEPEPAPQEKPSELPPPADARPASGQSEVNDDRVTHLFLNPLHTRATDIDRQPGDDGISIVLEPRNAAGEFVPVAGAVSVVVLDPTQSGDAARVARWDFARQDVEQAISRHENMRGIHLEMPWPASRPESQELRLFVRYETQEGRKLQADRELFIQQPGQFSQRWTPRPPERRRRNDEAIEVATSAGGARQPHDPPGSVVSASAIEEASEPSRPTPAPPPSLSEVPEQNRAPARPQWKPYR